MRIRTGILLVAARKDGTTTLLAKPRSDKGKTRKMTLDEVLEDLEHVRGALHGRRNESAFYRPCIERGLLQRERIVKAHELLKPDTELLNKRRLAFAKAHVNELWQVDTMFGLYVQHGTGKLQARLIAFLDRRRESRHLSRRIYLIGKKVSAKELRELKHRES